MPVVRTSAKGQVVIPANLRKRVGLRPGDKVSVQEQDGVIIIMPVAADLPGSLRGILKGHRSLIRALTESRERERNREEKEASRHLRNPDVAA